MVNIENYVNSYMCGLMDIFREYFNIDVARKVALEIVFLKLIKNNAKKEILKSYRHNFLDKLKDFLEGSKEVQEVINDLFRMRDFDDDIMAKTLEYMEKFNEDIPKDEEFRACIKFLYNDIRLNINTTDNLNILIKEILKETNFKTIYDPTIGTGMMITEVCKGHNDVKIYGQDIDTNSVKICKMLLIIEGKGRYAKNIYEGDVIKNPLHVSKNKLRTFDCIVNNHPFSLREWGHNKIIQNDDFNRFYRGIPSKSNGDYAFITHIVESLNEKGIAVIIETLGSLFRTGIDGNIRRRLIEENLIHSVISLPSNMMYGTALSINLLVIKKGRDTDDILFIDATDKGKTLKRLKVLEEKTIEEISVTFNEFKEEKGFSKLINREEILKNSGNLNARRYVERNKEREEIDLNSINIEMSMLKKKLYQVQSELDKYMN